MKLLSIIVPVFNEEANVEPLYRSVNDALARVAGEYEWEFVFTDNCSTDSTFERLRSLAEQDARVRVYRFSKNFGFQRSILTGYRLAPGDAAVQIDCDLQDPPVVILDFLKLWEAGYKVVFGVRKSRPEAFHRRAIRRFFYWLIAWLSGDELPRDAGDFRLIDRCVLDLLHDYRDESPYLRGYIASLGYQQIGVAYDRSERLRGESAFSFGSLIDLALDGIVSHSILPLRLASVIGVAAAALAGIAIIGYFVKYQRTWPAGFATLVILVLISISINALILGIMGEYLARVYRQTKPSPLTIVDRYIDRPDAAAHSPADRSTRAVAGIIFPAEDRQPEVSGKPRAASERRAASNDP